MFHILEQETQWRRENGRPEGFETMRASRPVVAVGAEDPLEDQKMLADYFRTYIDAGHRSLLTPTPQMGRMVWGGSTLAYVGYLARDVANESYKLTYSQSTRI